MELINNKTLELSSINACLLNKYIYKGKGILLHDERVIKKEVKKASFLNIFSGGLLSNSGGVIYICIIHRMYSPLAKLYESFIKLCKTVLFVACHFLLFQVLLGMGSFSFWVLFRAQYYIYPVVYIFSEETNEVDTIVVKVSYDGFRTY